MEKEILNFKRVEVSGATRDEAFAKSPFQTRMGDATQAFKLWKAKQTTAITRNMENEFMMDYLAKKSKNVPGAGFTITIEGAVSNTRERPYKVIEVVNKGKRKTGRVIRIFNDRTGEVVKEIEGTQAAAKQAMKELYKSGKLTDNVTAKIEYKVTEGEPIAFKMQYTPSKSSKQGQYIAFGIENA